MHNLSLVIGIDPGRRGALALLQRGMKAAVVDMPQVEGGALNLRLIASLLAGWIQPGAVVAIEAAIAPGGPGGRSGHGFSTYQREQGQLVGVAYGAVCTLPPGRAEGVVVEQIQPTSWKAHFGLWGGGKRGSADYLLDKGLATVADLTPARCRKPSDGRSDALMIAMYAAIRGGWNVATRR